MPKAPTVSLLGNASTLAAGDDMKRLEASIAMRCLPVAPGRSGSGNGRRWAVVAAPAMLVFLLTMSLKLAVVMSRSMPASGNSHSCAHSRGFQ